MNKITIDAIKDRIGYLEDNKYRYTLDDGGSGKWGEVIRSHAEEIQLLNQDLAKLEVNHGGER